MANAKYKKGKDGWYSTLVWDGTYTADGRKHRKQLRSNKSSRDLERIVDEFRRNVESRKVVINTNVTFVDYAKQWANTYKASTALNTRSMYENIINVHFRQLESVLLKDFRRIHLQSVLNSCSLSTGQKVYMCINQIIKSAIHDQYLPAAALDDIFEDVKSPKPPKSEKRALYPEEKEVIGKVVLDPMDKAYLWIIYGCGLRREEALALTVFDLDFKRSQIAVNKALVFDGNNPVLKDTKSENGVRNVPMPGYLSDYLKQYIHTISGTNLFWSRGKSQMTKSSYVKMWQRIRKEISRLSGCSCKDLTAHVFRHNYCTELCYQIPTVSIKRIAQLLGDTERVVMDVYNHILLDREDAATAVEHAVGIV